MIMIDWVELREAMNSPDNVGYCLQCGYRTTGIPPAGSQIYCSCCSQPAVYGAKMVFHMGRYKYTPKPGRRIVEM